MKASLARTGAVGLACSGSCHHQQRAPEQIAQESMVGQRLGIRVPRAIKRQCMDAPDVPLVQHDPRVFSRGLREPSPKRLQPSTLPGLQPYARRGVMLPQSDSFFATVLRACPIHAWLAPPAEWCLLQFVGLSVARVESRYRPKARRSLSSCVFLTKAAAGRSCDV